MFNKTTKAKESNRRKNNSRTKRDLRRSYFILIFISPVLINGVLSNIQRERAEELSREKKQK